MKRIFETRQSIVSYSIATLICIGLLLPFSPFVVPLLFAAIFAFALEPWLSKIGKSQAAHRGKFRGFARRVPVVITVLVFFLAIIAPLTFIIYKISVKVAQISETGVQNTQIFQAINRIRQEGVDYLSNLNPSLASEFSGDSTFLKNAGDWILRFVGGMAASLPDMILAFLVCLAAFYVFIVEAKKIKLKLIHLKWFDAEKLDQVIVATQEICHSTIISSLIIGIIQGLVVTGGAMIFGYSDFISIFIVTFFTSFIPVVGAGPVAFVLGANQFLLGETGAGIGLVVVSIVAGTVDNLIKPLMVTSGEKGINPIISIVVFVGAVMVYGFSGLLLGPVLLPLAVRVVPILFSGKDTQKDAP